MISFKWLPLLAALLPGPPALASDAGGHFSSLGLGGESCATYRTVFENSDTGTAGVNLTFFRFWIGGHLSGLNAWVPGAKDFVAPLSMDQAMTAVNGWCKEHPAANMDEAVTSLEFLLMQQHGAQPPRSYAPGRS
jgi:hypothetical protein